MDVAWAGRESLTDHDHGDTWAADPGSALSWSTLYTLETGALAAIVFKALRLGLTHRTNLYSWWCVSLGYASEPPSVEVQKAARREGAMLR